MYNFDRIASRKGSGSLKWTAMAAHNGNLAPEITPFSAADMEFKNAPEIVQAIKDFLDSDNGVLAYYGGYPAYYEAVCDWMQRRHDWKIEPDWIVDMNGVLPSLYVALASFTKPGDNVIIISPVYDPFYSIVGNNGRNIVTSSLVFKDGKYQMDFDDIEKKAKDEKTTMIFLCNPHTPVGRVWTKEELTRLARICIDNNVLIADDEAHHDLILPGYKHTCLASISEEIADHCVVFTAPSKGFNLAGMQNSSTIIKDPEMRKHYYDEVALGQEHYTVSPLGYRACEAAYRYGDKWLDELIEVIDNNRKFMTDYLAKNIPEIKVMPMEGTYLIWLDCRELGMKYDELEKFMKEKALLYLDEGHMFGPEGDGFERWNLACHVSVLEEALDRLKKAVDEWRKNK